MSRQVVGGKRVGALEAAVLDVLWAARQPLTGREVSDQLPGPVRAYTTVMTVLSRLVTKNLVERTEHQGLVRFRSAGDADQLLAREIGSLLQAAGDRRAVLAHLVGEVDDPELLAELREALTSRRER